MRIGYAPRLRADLREISAADDQTLQRIRVGQRVATGAFARTLGSSS